MALRVGFQMDPIEHVDIDADSSFRLAEEAQARGHENCVWTPDALFFDEGRVRARARRVNLRRSKGDHVTFGDVEVLDLSDLDVVWLPTRMTE